MYMYSREIENGDDTGDGCDEIIMIRIIMKLSNAHFETHLLCMPASLTEK